MVYSMLSTVPQNSVGTFSIISLMSGAVLDKHFPLRSTNETATDFDPDYDAKVGVSIAMTFMVGLFHLAFGLLNLGFLSILLPKPVVGGFTTASAIIVSLAQGTHIFGFPVQRYSGLAGPIYTFVDICKSIFGGMITWSSFIISVISIPILYSGKMAQIK